MATDTNSAYIRSLNICIYGESLSHPTGVTSVYAACTVTHEFFGIYKDHTIAVACNCLKQSGHE